MGGASPLFPKSVSYGTLEPLGPPHRVFDTFQVLGVILFLGFVFCVHHWNVSPEASTKEETSNPGQAQQLLRRVRNLVGEMLPNL